MPTNDKARPASLEPDDPLRATLERAAAGDVDERLTFDLRVSGGMPSQAYRLEHRIGGDRRARASRVDERAGRRREADRTEIEHDELAAVARQILDSGVLDVPVQPPRFLPDTVVGLIEISDGEHTFRVWFAADPDQASVQESPPRPEVLRAVDALYASAGGLMDEESLGP
jgi:hypothetical protein